MINDNYIYYPLRDLLPGETFKWLKTPNNGEIFADFEVVRQEGFFTVLKVYGIEEKYLTENAYAKLPISAEMKREKYAKEGQEIISAMKNKLPFEPSIIGHHEMDNSWIDCDPYDMAEVCKDKHITVLGYCDLGEHSRDDLNIAIVAEDNIDKNRFWCHGSSDWFYGKEWQPSEKDFN